MSERAPVSTAETAAHSNARAGYRSPRASRGSATRIRKRRRSATSLEARGSVGEPSCSSAEGMGDDVRAGPVSLGSHGSRQPHDHQHRACSAPQDPLPHNGHDVTSLTRSANRTNPNHAMPLGYVPFEAEAANLFFQLISNRYERASVIVTSNKPFGRWGEVFGDETVAAAMIDRLAHHAEVHSLKAIRIACAAADGNSAASPPRLKKPTEPPQPRATWVTIQSAKVGPSSDAPDSSRRRLNSDPLTAYQKYPLGDLRLNLIPAHILTPPVIGAV
ncbi:ATP-binding protein [Streptomyces atratus]|uniref:ATP-binding protein n=1 Tax=Streptomyces atratus TaxID=1893 RepID=UPI002B1D5050|nr:ATP-binding protein [Streptomyces atratus]